MGAAVAISEVYGAGAEGGPFNRDFVELFNRDVFPVDLTGWNLQYAPAGSPIWQAVPLSGEIAPGQYLLVGLAGTGPGAAIPTPDLSGSINLNPFSGQVALVRDTAPLVGADPYAGRIEDLFGYGAAMLYEGPSSGPAPGIAFSAQRKEGGLTDWDSNLDDFEVAAPTPANSSTFHPQHENLAPIVAVPDQTYYEAGATVEFDWADGSGLIVADYDSAGASVELTLAASVGGLTLSGTTGLTFTVGDGADDATMTCTGTVAAVDAALQGMTYAPGTGYTGNATLLVALNDLGNHGLGGAKGAVALAGMTFGPALHVEASDPLAVGDGQDTATFTIRRTGPTTSALDAEYAMSGTAEFGTDYGLSWGGGALGATGTVTFAPGEAEVVVTLTPVDHGPAAPDKTFELVATAGPAVVVSPKDRGTGKIVSVMWGLNKSKKPDGTNHEAAHAKSKGTDVKVGVIEALGRTAIGVYQLGINAKRTQLEGRLIADQNFVLRKRVAAPLMINAAGAAIGTKNNPHSELVAAVIAGNSATYTGVAPEAKIAVATVNNIESAEVAADVLYTSQNAYIQNISLNDRTLHEFELREYVDWFTYKRDTLFVVAAGNDNSDDKGPITSPGDAYNAITVGAVGMDFQTRAVYSGYRSKDEQVGVRFNPNFQDNRGLPHVLAPGGDMVGFMGNGVHADFGTSLAAPYVSGIAALLAKRQTGDLALGTTDRAAHLAYKAIILNSARKRYISEPKNTYPYAKDNDATKNQKSDLDYLTQVGGQVVVADSGSPPDKTALWTPSKWESVAIPGKAYRKLVVYSPLDDEQGTGVADAERALIQYNGGDGNASGKKGPGNVAAKIGWNIDKLKLGAGGAPASHTYTLDYPVTEGTFLTLTLVTDRIMEEKEAGGGAANNAVQKSDEYEPFATAPMDSEGIPEFTLTVKYKGTTIAVWQKGPTDPVDPVGHLHLPLPENGAAKDYEVVVELKNHGKTVATEHNYALAWWTA